MRQFLLRLLLFAILPAVVLEGAARLWLRPEITPWYIAVSEQQNSPPMDVLFAGSSRVAAAVDAKAFGDAMEAALGHRVRVENFGRGTTTLIEHYFGLREMWRTPRATAPDCTVFVESPAGVPLLDAWDSDWYMTPSPHLLAPYIDRSDLPKFWRDAREPWPEKLQFTVLAGSRFVMAVLRLRLLVLSMGERWSIEAFGPLKVRNADLRDIGGIRVDSAGIDLARKQASEEVRVGNDEHTALTPDWDRLAMHDLVRLAHENGCTVAFFELPMSSHQAVTMKRHAKASALADFRDHVVGEWGARYIGMEEFRFDDSDFPDAWHLRASRSAEFSTMLARKWLASSGVVAAGK